MQEITFDGTVYAVKAIKNAAYDLSSKAVIKIRAEDQNRIIVEMTPRSGMVNNTEEIIAELTNGVLDHQIRLETAKDFQTIREMIVAQAFAPCDNLDEVVRMIKP